MIKKVSAVRLKLVLLKIKPALKRYLVGVKPEGPIHHGKIWLDAMSGMAMGFLASLVVASIIGILGIYSSDNVFLDVKRVVTFLTPFAIGVGIGMRAKLDALRTLSLALVVFVASRSELVPRAVTGQIEFSPLGVGISTDLAYVGDVLSTIFTGAIMLYLFQILSKVRSNWDFLVVPLVAMLVGIALGFSLTYVITLVTVCIELIIYYTAATSAALAIAVAPVIGAIMGAAITLPISSAALAVGLKLQGDAALAALAGTSAQMMCWMVMTQWSGRKWSTSIIVGFGSSMLHITNYSRRPQLLLLPIVISALTALVSVAIYSGRLAFPLGPGGAGVVTSGMGTVALYGPIFTMQDNRAWASVDAWTNALFMQILLPIVLSALALAIAVRFFPRFMRKEWLELWNDIAPTT